jgi:hypothetical protein
MRIQIGKAIVRAAPVALVGFMVLSSGALGALQQPVNPYGPGDAVTTSTIQTILEQIANFLITAGVVVAVIFIVLGGVQFMRGKPDEGKKILTNAAIGVAIIFAVGLIMSTIARVVQTRSIT